MIVLFFALAVPLGILIFFVKTNTSRRSSLVVDEFKGDWKILLTQHVLFYRSLSETEKSQFEQRLIGFLKSIKITGINTSVEELDLLLVASSAIIPVFGFPRWQYRIKEVLLYPSLFNDRFETGKPDSKIGGMVGNGALQGIMILSKPLLRKGYSIANDKMNVGIHEFMHLIDMEDGEVDGIPKALIENAASLPWMELCKNKIDQILKNKSDINPYGATCSEEFFAVAGEYFFEKPDMLKQKHLEVYQFLEKAFNQKMSERFSHQLYLKPVIRRNSPCPCGSGRKFKHCCGR